MFCRVSDPGLTVVSSGDDKLISARWFLRFDQYVPGTDLPLLKLFYLWSKTAIPVLRGGTGRDDAHRTFSVQAELVARYHRTSEL